MPAVNRAMTPLEWTLLLTLSLLWGGSFFFVGIAVKELPPLTIVALRVVLAALALDAVTRFTRLRVPATRDAWSAFLAMGLLNNAIPFGLIAWGQTHLASGVAAILNATTPLFTAVVAHLSTADEKLTTGRPFGVAVGFVGVAVMIGGTALHALDDGVLAQIAVLGAALSYAFAGVFGRRFRAMGIAPITTASGQVTASTILLAPAALLVDRPWMLPWPSAHALAAVAGLALVSTALAYVLFFRILATAGALNAALVTFLIPASAVLLGVLVLGETLLPRHLAGMALIWTGLAAVDGRPWRAFRTLRRRSPPARS